LQNGGRSRRGSAVCTVGCLPSHIVQIISAMMVRLRAAPATALLTLTLTLTLTLPYGLGNAGTRVVSMILEYSMDTLPARSILVALPGSA
jgi:hypothetical protein